MGVDDEGRNAGVGIFCKVISILKISRISTLETVHHQRFDAYFACPIPPTSPPALSAGKTKETIVLVDPAQDLRSVLTFVSEVSRPPTQLRMATTGDGGGPGGVGGGGRRAVLPLDFNPSRPSVSGVLADAKLMDSAAFGGAAKSWLSGLFRR